MLAFTIKDHEEQWELNIIRKSPLCIHVHQYTRVHRIHSVLPGRQAWNGQLVWVSSNLRH